MDNNNNGIYQKETLTTRTDSVDIARSMSNPQGELDPNSIFYSGMSGTTPYQQRVLSMNNTNANVPVVVEIVQATVNLFAPIGGGAAAQGDLVFYFRNQYKNVPYINGEVNLDNQRIFNIPALNLGLEGFPFPFINTIKATKTNLTINIIAPEGHTIHKGKIRIYNLFTDSYGSVPSFVN